MGRDSKDFGQAVFLQHLKKTAIFHIKNKAQNLFAELVANIPFPSYLEKKQRGKTIKKRNKKTRNKHVGEKLEAITNISNKSRKINTREAEARKSKEITEESRVKTHYEDRHKKASEYKKERCKICKKEYEYINDHYLSVHKIHRHTFVNKLHGKLIDRDMTACLSCETDYGNFKSLVNHLVGHHNFTVPYKVRKGSLINKKPKIHKVVEATKVKKIESTENKPAAHKVSEMVEDNSNGQKENGTIEPAARGIIGNSKQDERKAAPTLIQRRCKHCDEFVSVSSFKSHIAAHERDRAGFQFQLSNCTSMTSSQKDSSSNSNGTAEKGDPTEQGDIVKPAVANGVTEARDETYNGSIHRKEFQTARDVRDKGSDSVEANAIGSDTADPYTTQNEDSIEAKRKARVNILWNYYYQRMLVVNENERQELYHIFVKEYASVALKNGVCVKRLHLGATRPRQQRVEVTDTLCKLTFRKFPDEVASTPLLKKR